MTKSMSQSIDDLFGVSPASPPHSKYGAEVDRSRDSMETRISNTSPTTIAFREFCASTSLHGWHHLNQVKNTNGRVVWLVIVIASLAVASVFLGTAAIDFMDRSVVTTIETTTASLQVGLLISTFIMTIIL